MYTRDWAGLQPYLKRVEYTGKSLGFGTYGSVEVVIYRGKECAAKSFRTDFSPEQKPYIVKNFTTELQILSRIRHVNIVRYIGANFKKDCELPLLIMEKLKTDLHKYLEKKKQPGLSLHRKFSILYDTVNGLHFLHTRKPAVIHRDLTAKNVLLDASLTAKIADFGNSRIVDLDVATRESMTCNVGTIAYSAPEVADKDYGPPIDVFSFGHLSLFTVNQIEPRKILKAVERLRDGNIHGRTEVERRAEYFEMLHQHLQQDHQIIRMIKKCLDIEPSQRPTTLEIVTILKDELKIARTAH